MHTCLKSPTNSEKWDSFKKSLCVCKIQFVSKIYTKVTLVLLWLMLHTFMDSYSSRHRSTWSALNPSWVHLSRISLMDTVMSPVFMAPLILRTMFATLSEAATLRFGWGFFPACHKIYEISHDSLCKRIIEDMITWVDRVSRFLNKPNSFVDIIINHNVRHTKSGLKPKVAHVIIFKS